MDRRQFVLSATILPLFPLVASNESDVRKAIDDMKIKGGTLYLPPGDIVLSGDLTIPDGINLWGQGAGWSAKGTVFHGAGIRFGERGKRNTGGISGNFTIMGGQLYLGRSLQRMFQTIDVLNAPSDAVRIEEGQNNLFQNVNSNAAGNCGVVLDAGAGGNLFQRCEMNAAQSAAVWIADQIKGEGHIYATPTHNKFDHCIFERSTVGLRSSAGMDNTFDTCVFADPAAVAVVDVEAATRLRIRDCTFFGSRRSTGLRVGRGAVVVLSGVNRFNTLGRVSDIKPGAQVTMGQIQQSAIGKMQ